MRTSRLKAGTPNPAKGRELLATAVLVIAGAFGSMLIFSGGGRVASAAGQDAASPSLLDCGPDVPLVKCNASLYSPDPAVTFPPPGETPPSAAAPEAETCGPDFFDSSQIEQLTERFGSIQCFRFIGSKTWVVVGDGMSLTAEVQEATPGGAVVATETCGDLDDQCLDGDANHSFGDFTVSYPPEPSSGRTQVQFIAEGRFVMVYNGGCGLFNFDAQTLAWYQPSLDVQEALLAGETPVQVNVPSLTNGDSALSANAPDGTGDCQPVAS